MGESFRWPKPSCAGKWLRQHGHCRRALCSLIVTSCDVSAEIRRHRSGADFEHKHNQLVRDPLFDRQPVQLVELVISLAPEKDPGCTILDSLNLVDVAGRSSWRKQVCQRNRLALLSHHKPADPFSSSSCVTMWSRMSPLDVGHMLTKLYTD